jgi:hypothetical protein
MQEDMKYDKGKPIAGCLLTDFPRALLAISELSTIGAKKYERSSWLTVPNGRQRYTDAMMRHALAEYTEGIDHETGVIHEVATAWNALARLELTLRQLEADNE